MILVISMMCLRTFHQTLLRLPSFLVGLDHQLVSCKTGTMVNFAVVLYYQFLQYVKYVHIESVVFVA